MHRSWLPRSNLLAHYLLFAGILLYLLLPALGGVWHRVVPEHEHLFLGVVVAEVDLGARPEAVPNTFEKCIDCPATVLHLPNPTGSLATFTIVLMLSSLPLLRLVGAFLGSLTSPFIYLRPPLLIQLDPPPNTF